MTRKYQDLTAVLVHAAWADASSWNEVTAPLQKLGIRVRSAQIPLTSLSDDVAALKRLLRQVEGPVLLTAHSYAGAVITAAGADNPQVKALVYIAAIVPDEGETVGALFQRAEPEPSTGPHLVPDADGFLWLPPGIETPAYIDRAIRQLRVTRLGEPADVAELVAFLSSGRSRWMQGSIVDVDGGQNKGV